MPMGPYKDFDACLKDQKSKGKSDKASAGICGMIKKKAGEKENISIDEIKLIEKKFDSDGYIIIAENVPIIFSATITPISSSGERKK